MNRRVGKKVNGTLVVGWIYDDNLRIIAETDGSGAVTKRFVYGDRPNVPESMTWQGGSYRIITDHLGTPRYVLEASGGTAAQMMSVDEFGNVQSDSRPGFQPFGFAGGLYDPDTHLVRFGARDYDPLIGRWTTKDPLLFDGGTLGLYEYVYSDPVNNTDPTGLATSADVARVARSYRKSRKWSKKTAKGGVPAGKYKCSLFVADVANEAHAHLPLLHKQLPFLHTNYHYPTAGELGDPSVDIPNWPVTNTPVPGDIAAEKEMGGEFINDVRGYSGHSGIVSGPGTTISQSAVTDQVEETSWGFRPGDNIVFRHYTGP